MQNMQNVALENYQISEGCWLSNEKRKIENYFTENFQEFTVTFQQEVDAIKNYLDTKRLAALQRRREEEQRRLLNAKQREEEWKRKANFTLEIRKKVDEGSKKKRIDKIDKFRSKMVEPEIELPEMDSDSEMEMEDKNKICPDWCRPSDLKAALRRQAFIDPEEIFGKVQPLNIEEIFKDRRNKFRQRSSSSNWADADALTSEEEKEYKLRMGFN
ncbi:150_t:CDS:2 [Diversispora eburnea]|uniref:150_t:CDS:1 n=1 Tax=Diversispora eburnea TaxID=1213867 RepID=A0A9N9B643_9GLOM|nr:150_t:CDS:2 [Diversispora eburnea]